MNLFEIALQSINSRGDFLNLLVLLFFTLLLSLLFHRKIVSLYLIGSWLVAVPFLIFLIVLQTVRASTPTLGMVTVPTFLKLFIGLLFSLFSFIFSDIFRLIPRIRKIQERFNRYRWYVIFLSILFLVFSPIFSILLGALAHYRNQGIVTLISIIFLVLLWIGWIIYLYLKSAKAPPSKLEFNKRDYIIPGVLIIVFISLGFLVDVKSPLLGPDLILEQFRQQMLIDLQAGDKKLSSPLTKITLLKNDSTFIVIGVKNVKQGTLKYKVVVEAEGGFPVFGDDISDNFLYSSKAEELQPTDTRVIPIRVTSETAAGTGLFKLSVIEVTEGEPGTVYDSKSFFITVTD